jgi:hypothetical protein
MVESSKNQILRIRGNCKRCRVGAKGQTHFRERKPFACLAASFCERGGPRSQKLAAKG